MCINFRYTKKCSNEVLKNLSNTNNLHKNGENICAFTLIITKVIVPNKFYWSLGI